MTGERGGRRQRRKEARPGEIVRAAMEVFAEVGFGAAKVAEIAKRAGVAKGTVYLYFQTKDELFEAAVRAHMNPAYARVEEIASSFPGSASEMLVQFVGRLYAEMADNAARRTILRILIAEGERFPSLTVFYHREFIARAQRLVRQIVQRGIEQGEFRPTAAMDHPGAIIGPAVMAAVWRMTFEAAEPLDTAAFSAAHLDVVLNGLRRRDDP